MYKHILIATDGSELATKALEHGLALAKRDNSQTTVVTVTEPWSALDVAGKAVSACNLWQHRALPASPRVETKVEAHDVTVLHLGRCG